MSGFTIIALATISIFFINDHKVWLWALILFATRVGAATIEVMSDAYFFKHIKPENEEYVGIFRSITPLSYIIGPVAASAFFLFLPQFNFIYVILGTIMLFGIYLSSTIDRKDI
jgi:MFS family permease